MPVNNIPTPGNAREHWCDGVGLFRNGIHVEEIGGCRRQQSLPWKEIQPAFLRNRPQVILGAGGLAVRFPGQADQRHQATRAAGAARQPGSDPCVKIKG